jgi:hypothetical protein
VFTPHKIPTVPWAFLNHIPLLFFFSIALVTSYHITNF